MTKQIYVNVPVMDLARSVAFYTVLGFEQIADYSNEKVSAMRWSDEIILMLVTHPFYASFLKGQTIADTKTTNAALLCLTLDSRDEVRKFAETAKDNGGDFYTLDLGVPEDEMFGYEVLDPDGNHWEPIWMKNQVS